MCSSSSGSSSFIDYDAPIEDSYTDSVTTSAMAHPIHNHPYLKRMSNSSDELLDSCPRKYELYKLSPGTKYEDTEDTSFGSLVGIGTQEILTSNSIERAYWEMFKSWKRDIDDDDGLAKKKTFWHGLLATDKFYQLRNSVLSQYKIAIFDGQPATELGFSIDCGGGFFYRGFLDALLTNTNQTALLVYEGKTTGSTANEAMYKNRGQALGYSLIIDLVAKKLGIAASSSFHVKYAVYQSKKQEWEIFDFVKNNTQRALWLKQLLLRMRDITIYIEEGYFPQRGQSCYNFFKECPYYSTCGMSNSILLDATIPVVEEEESKYQFKFTLDELIMAQIEKGSL